MPLLTLPIVHAAQVSPRNRSVRLGLGGHAFSFSAGQYVLLAEHGLADRRPYSIASAPLDAGRLGFLEFLIQVNDRGSPGPHLPDLSEGRLIDVEGPEGSFTLPEDLRASDVLLVCGGTGVAPIRSMLRQLLETASHVRAGVLQSGRAPEDLSYGDELRELARCGRIRLVQTVTREAPASWGGITGRIGEAQLRAAITGSEPECFVCGPDSLVAEVPRLLAALGVPASRVHTEHWADQ